MLGDRFQWVAIYNDGSVLHQIEPDGTKNAYGDIDRTRLSFFQMREGEMVIVNIPFEPGQRLIWRRRTEMSPGGGKQEAVHIIGKQETVDGENRQVVIALFESDGHTEVSDRYDEEHPWFFPITLHPHEGEE